VVSPLPDDEKENRVIAEELSALSNPKELTKDTTKSTDSTLSDTSRKDVPTTPSGRLALPDLIGMGDIRRAVQDVSPEDRIEWDQHSVGSSGRIKRARKRARSSSPIPSPAKTPGRFNKKGESLHPPVDPGSELWGRYSLNGSNAPTPQGPTIPALAHIMHTSSPQPCKEKAAPRSAVSLRRAKSCGIQFPKRRRVGGPDEDDVFTESVNLGPSKISVLIERVQEGLAQPKQEYTETKSSDLHLPRETHFDGGESRAPVGQISLEMGTAAQNQSIGDESHPQPKSDMIPNPPPVRSDSSDYGDFDDDELDDETLLNAITKSEVPIYIPPNKPTLEVPPDPPPEMLPSAKVELRRPLSVKDSKTLETSTFKTGDDEFDDLDEDLLAADLEDMVAKFDDQNPTEAKVSSINKPRKDVTVSKADSDDEFGDDGLDDLDFEVAQAAATQSIQQTANSLLPVRTRLP